MNAQIDSDLNRFALNQTVENAKRVIADIKMFKSYQILGEQYAQSFYTDRIDDEYDKKIWATEEVFYTIFTPVEEQVEAILEAGREWNRKTAKLEEIVNKNFATIDSFYIPE